VVLCSVQILHSKGIPIGSDVDKTNDSEEVKNTVESEIAKDS